MAVKKGLGRGLGALITQAANDAENDESLKTAPSFEMDINKIEPNPAQPRKHFDKASLEELAQSVKEHGIIQPIIVSKGENDRYFIVAGERRWRAARLLKLDTVPVIIKDYSASETLQVALIENLQREDINPVEEALSYKRLIDEFFFRREDIAQKVGKSATRVSSSLALLDLCDPVLEMLAAGEINASSAKTLLKLEDKETQAAVAKKIAEDGLTAKEAEAHIASIDKLPSKAQRASTRSSVYDHLERDLNIALGTKVRIQETKNGGKIQIEYYSKDDLDRLVCLLKEH